MICIFLIVLISKLLSSFSIDVLFQCAEFAIYFLLGLALVKPFLCVLYCVEMYVMVQPDVDFEPITDMMVCDHNAGVSVIAVRLSRLLHTIPTRLLKCANRLELLDMA